MVFHNTRPNRIIRPQATSSYSARILVVEDEFAIRQLHTHVLVRSGYQVDTAADGVAGWEALQREHFDILITDHQMPRLSGLALVNRILCEGLLLPVILVSVPVPADELDRDTSLRLSATLLKPFSPYQLEEIVKEVLGRMWRELSWAAEESQGRCQSAHDQPDTQRESAGEPMDQPHRRNPAELVRK